MTRDYGSGRLVERGPKKWLLRVSAGTDLVTGKRRTITETVYGGKREAQHRLAEIVAQHGGVGRRSTSTVRLGRMIDAWLDVAQHARGTRENYDRARGRIPQAMLAAPAARVQPHDVQDLYTAVGREFGPHAAQYLYALLSGAYSHARRLRWVVDNPARDLVLPAITKRATSTPMADDVLRILAAAADQQEALWLRLAAVTGRRRAELPAVRWSDVDLAAGVLRVERALEPDGTAKATKSKDHAQVALDAVTVARIRSWQVAQRERALAAGVPLDPDPYLLSYDPASGRPWRPDFATRRFATARARAGVPAKIRLQDMRHANVTFLIANGVDARTVAGRVGHDPAMTLGTYSAIVDAANRAAAELIAAALDAPAQVTER